MLFRGQFVHAIDAKGRVSLPARFRDIVAADGDGRVVLTGSVLDPCLHLFPLRTWEELERKFSGMSLTDRNALLFQRMYVSAAIDCELDKAGRVLIPPQLREKAFLSKEVVWAGMGRIVEVWSKDRWNQALSLTPEQLQAFQQAVMEQIRL